MKVSGRQLRRLMLCEGGVSLVELMVALVLSMVLMAGVGQIYLGSKQTYRIQEGQSRLQENARYALEVLSRDIRSVSYMGCKPFVPFVVPLARSCPTGYFRSSSTDLQCQPVPPNVIARAPVTAPASTADVLSGQDNIAGSIGSVAVVKGTSAITVQFGASCGGNVAVASVGKNSITLSPTNTCGTITPSKNCGAKGGCSGGKVLLVANCSKADVFRASTVTNNDDGTVTIGIATTENTSLLSSVYDRGEMMLFNSYTYFIGVNPSGEPALYRFDNNANSSDEVVEGIENMQIQYGVDTDATPDGSANLPYQKSTDGVNWTRVLSVQIILTVRPYNSDVNYYDQRLVKNFTSTISLRNRLQSTVNLP